MLISSDERCWLCSAAVSMMLRGLRSRHDCDLVVEVNTRGAYSKPHDDHAGAIVCLDWYWRMAITPESKHVVREETNKCMYSSSCVVLEFAIELFPNFVPNTNHCLQEHPV